MDVSNLILQLKSLINDNTLDQLHISKAIKLLEVGSVEQVGEYSSLPNASENEGKLYYITYDGLYWSTGTLWLPIVLTSYAFAWSWGSYSYGRLGNDSSYGDKSSPVNVLGGFTDWCQVSGGSQHSLGLRSNGTAWAWGRNYNGQLGDGTSVYGYYNDATNRSSPVSVVGDFTDWCQVSAGGYHSLGIRSNGTAWVWGNNYLGQLGDYTTYCISSPVSVVGGFTDWCQVSAGTYHSLGVRSNGTAWAWGSNSYGKLGDGFVTFSFYDANTSSYIDCIENRSSPVSVVGGFTDWCQVSAGDLHSLGLRSNGTLWAWGGNCLGQLGDYTTYCSSSPVSVVGGFTDWCQVSAGGTHSLGIRTNCTLWAWGNNYLGQLGDNTTYCISSPVSVIGGFTDWCQVSGGNEHSLGLRSNGTAWAWGRNCNGQLGDGTSTTYYINNDRSSPVSVVGGFTDWCQASAGGCHSLGITAKEL
jgi:alpha-tubulin suppressor-like RCC1 family protein